MKTAICTLFEGDYHLGLGALANSLHVSGFKGVLYAGYRGALPAWCSDPVVGVHQVNPDFRVEFRLLTTNWHFTNYKPTFMRELWASIGETCDQLFYFDPDIVVKAQWSEFEHWAACGVAVVEDAMNGRIGPSHPLRHRWRSFASRHGRSVLRETDQFVNGGFVGVSRENRAFLEHWASLIDDVIAEHALDPKVFMHHKLGRAFPFISVDQDTLNLAIMIAQERPSIAGPEAMDFVHGGYFMSHAIASPKPWRPGILRAAFRGCPPSLATKLYWAHVDGPIVLFPPRFLRMKRWEIALAVLICRFYKRN